MLAVTVNIQDAGARSGIAAIIAAMENPADLHEAMTDGVELGVRKHLVARNAAKSPHTNFYSRAAESITKLSNDAGGEVTIPERGMRLRHDGGRVMAGANISNHTGEPTKYLALPTDKVPVRNEMRLRPKDAGILAFIPNRGGPSVTGGYLVEGEEKTITRGPRKGGKRIVPKAGGEMMFVLRAWTDHDPDPTVLPSLEDLLSLASTAAGDYFDSFTEGGLS